MGLAEDFAEIHVVDPARSPRTKQDVFADIMARHGYQPADVLVIGDDLDSEIKAAQALGIDTVLYDREGHYPTNSATHTIARFTELAPVLSRT